MTKVKKNHSPFFYAKIGKQVCSYCGLIYFNNKATQKAIKGPCRNGDG